MGRLTARQEQALELLRAARMPGNRGYYGLDLAHLAKALGTSPEGAAATCSSLARRGLATAFRGGVGRQRMHYQAVPPVEVARAAAERNGVDPALVREGDGGSIIVDVPLPRL